MKLSKSLICQNEIKCSIIDEIKNRNGEHEKKNCKEVFGDRSVLKHHLLAAVSIYIKYGSAHL